MDPSNSSIEHEVKVKKEPVDEDEETRLDHNLSHLTNGWFEFRCNSGEVLFYFNIFSNEHRWMGNKCTCSKETLEEISSQSIGIQCDIDSKPKEIPSQDVSTETDFSFLGEQKARIAVSVQTEVSVIPDKSFRDEDLSKDSIFPLEFVLPKIDPSTLENDGYFKPLCANVHDSEQIARAPESSLDSTPITEERCDNNNKEVTEEPEEITNNPSLTLGRAEMQNEQSDESKEFLNEGKSNDLSAELNDGQCLKKQHSLNKNSLDCETSPEENSSDLSYEPADEYGYSVRDIVDETSCSNNISSQEQNLNKDQSITSVSSNDDIREVAASEEKFLLETEKNCENVVSSLADICHSVLKRHFSGVISHSDCNPSTDEACEKETENDSCPSNVKTSREENSNTSALSSFDGELPSDSCPKSDDNTQGREESKETQHQESEQSATPISCKKVKPQTARKCANSLRKCLMVQEKVSRLSNIGNFSKSTKWYLRKRSFRNKTFTDPFSKRLKILLTPLEQDLPCIGRQLKSTFNKEDDGLSRSEQVRESDVHSRQNSNENTIRDTIPNPQTISIENQHGPGSEPSVTTAGIARNVCLYLTESNQVVMHIVSTEVDVSSDKYREDHPQTTKKLKDVSECVLHSPEKRKTRRKRKGHIKFYPAKNQRKRKTPVQRSVNCVSFVHTPFTEGSGLVGEERQIDKDEVKENHFLPSNNRENAENSSRGLSMDENHEILEGNELVEHFILNENPDDSNQENISKDLLFVVGDEVSNEHLVVEKNNEDVGEIREVGGEIELQSHPSNKNDGSGEQSLVEGDLRDENQVVENSNENGIQGALKEIEPPSHSTNKDSSPGDHPLLGEESQDVSQVVENSNEDRIQGALKEIEPRNHSTNKDSCPEDEPLVDEKNQDANQVVENSNEDEIQEALNEIEPRSHATNKDSSPEDQPLVDEDLQDKNHVLETPKKDCIQRHENEKDRHCNPCSKGSSSGHQLLTDADCETIPVVEKSYKEEFREEGHNFEPKDRPTFQDDLQKAMDDKELHVKEKKGPDGNDDNDTQGKAKENIQDFQYRLESLHKFDQNQNECKDICVDKGVETQNKSMETNRHLEDQLQDLSMMQENEDAYAYAVGNDAQSKPKEKTEKLEGNHEQSPILNQEHQRGIEIEIERENGVKSDEKESESKTDENQEKIGRECQEHGDRVAGCILEDGNSGIPDETKEMEIVGSDETRAEYESQKQEKSQDPEQKLPDVEASGQITKETEPISQGCQSDDPSADIIPIHLDSKLTPTPDKDAENNPRNSVGYSKPSRQYRRRVDLGCKFCDKKFKSSFKLSCHLRGHKVQKPKTCKICLRTFRSHSLLCEHLKYHNTTSKYSCSYCNEGFISHQKLVSHFIKCNETKSPSKKTSNGSNTTRDEVSLAAPLLKDGPQLDAVSRSNLTCNICNVIYAYPKSFRKHLKLHSRLPNGTAAENAPRESYKALDNYTNNENCKARSLAGDETVSNDGVSESQTITSIVDSDKNAKPFTCSICGMHFVKAYWFDRHMQYKHGISPGENPAGAEDAASPLEDVDEDSETLSVVSDDNTDGNTENSFECSICGMAYTKAFWLTRHMQNKHGVSMEDSCVTKVETSTSDVVDKADGNPLDCSVCGMRFKLECWLNRHKEKKHGISAEEVPTVAPSPEPKKDELTDTGESHPQLKNVVKIVSGEGHLKCYRCGIVFKKEYWYKRHVKIKHGMFVEIVPPPSPAQTPEPKNDKRNGTEKASKSANESQKNHPQMQERAENMTEKEKNERQMYKCKVCDREFVHLGHLENHSKHHGFVNKNNTKETGTSPRNVVPEKAPLEVGTNAGNDRNSSLGTEVRSNDENVVIGYKQNNFKCSKCPEEFAHLDDLIKHSSRTHAPCKCPHCEVRCSTSEELQSHLQIHRNDAGTDGGKKISCKICGKEVSTAVELITHFRTHKKGSRKRKVSKTQEKESPPSEEQSSSKSLQPTGSKSSDVPNSQTGKEASTVQDPKKTLSESVVPKSPKSTEPIRNPKKQRNLRVSVFFCYLCNKAFHNVGKRLLHMKRSHPDGNRYVCSTCGRGFQESHLYNLHKLEHRDMNSAESQAVSSNECSRIPESSRNDARSIQTVPIIRADQHFRYRCSDCGRGFQREHFYNMHKLKLHSATSTETQTDRTEISNGNDNSVNTEMSHNDVDCIPKEIDFPKNNSTEDLGSQSTARPVSFNAGVSTKRQLALGRKYFKCSMCSRKFFKKKNLRRHEHEHGDNMQSNKIPCISKGSSTCQPTARLSLTVINTSAAQESTSLATRDNETAIFKNDQSQNTPGRLEEMPRQEKILEFPYIETSCKGESDVFESASSKASLTNESQNDSNDTICQEKNDAATESAYVFNKDTSGIENSMTNESEDDIIDVVGDSSSGFVTESSSVCHNETPSTASLINEIQNITIGMVNEDKYGSALESTILCKSDPSNEINLTKESQNVTHSPSRSVFQYLNLETQSCATLAGEKYKCSYCTLSFTSLYQRNSHVFTTHKMRLKQGLQHEGPGLLETANQAAGPQVSTQVSFHITQDESELSKSLDNKESINSSAKENDHSNRKRKHDPNIIRRSKIGRHVLHGDDLDDQDGSILSETIIRNDSSFIESLEEESSFIFDFI